MEKAALVTGGTRGIGRGIASVLLRRGWRVALCGTGLAAARDTATALRQETGAPGDAIRPLAFAVEEPDGWEAALDAAEAALGPLTGLVCNAGISPKRAGRKIPLGADGDAQAWARTFAVNVDGAVIGTRRFAARCAERGMPGSVVLMSSIAARVGLPFVPSYYSASKAAILGFVRMGAHDLGARGIRLNAVAPGRIETDMVREAGAALNRRIAEETALGRLGHPEEVGEAVEFLLSDRASFITGTCLNVTGGWMES